MYWCPHTQSGRTVSSLNTFFPSYNSNNTLQSCFSSLQYMNYLPPPFKRLMLKWHWQANTSPVPRRRSRKLINAKQRGVSGNMSASHTRYLQEVNSPSGERGKPSRLWLRTCPGYLFLAQGIEMAARQEHLQETGGTDQILFHLQRSGTNLYQLEASWWWRVRSNTWLGAACQLGRQQLFWSIHKNLYKQERGRWGELSFWWYFVKPFEVLFGPPLTFFFFGCTFPWFAKPFILVNAKLFFLIYLFFPLNFYNNVLKLAGLGCYKMLYKICQSVSLK